MCKCVTERFFAPGFWASIVFVCVALATAHLICLAPFSVKDLVPPPDSELTPAQLNCYYHISIAPRPQEVALPLSTGGCFFAMRTIVFFDGQNLFRTAKAVWGGSSSDPSSPYNWPSYDVQRLAQCLVSLVPGRTLKEIRFYTGVHDRDVRPTHYWFWTNKLDQLMTEGIYVYRGRVSRYAQEKGVDVSLAVDLVQATHEQRYEVAIIVSKDSDFGPAVKLAKTIAKAQGRQLVFESAFPVGENTPRRKRRGVPGTQWVYIDRAAYDACRDWNDYRPRKH